MTFDKDSDNCVDNVEIEDEDWIDYTSRSTADSTCKTEHAKIRCLNQTHRKIKWKLEIENCDITE